MMLDLNIDGLAALLLVAAIPATWLGAFVSWYLVRRRWGEARTPIWLGIWATLPEMVLITVAWLAIKEPGEKLGIAGYVVCAVLLLGAIQCASAEIAWLNGERRSLIVWTLAHAVVPASIVVFVVLGRFSEAPLTLLSAVLAGAYALWRTWPLRNDAPRDLSHRGET